MSSWFNFSVSNDWSTLFVGETINDFCFICLQVWISLAGQNIRRRNYCCCLRNSKRTFSKINSKNVFIGSTIIDSAKDLFGLFCRGGYLLAKFLAADLIFCQYADQYKTWNFGIWNARAQPKDIRGASVPDQTKDWRWRSRDAKNWPTSRRNKQKN